MSDEETSYDQVKALYPLAVQEIEKQIRESRSVHKEASFDSFNWYIRRANPPATSHAIRVYIRKGQLMRCSSLYDGNNKIPGNWSF